MTDDNRINGREIVAFDFETFPIGNATIFPEPVCVSTADQSGASISVLTSMSRVMRDVLTDNDVHLVAQKSGFDLGVAALRLGLMREVLQAILDERVYCTKLAEKLLDLADFGSNEFQPLPNGEVLRLKYGLEDLVRKYLDIDISEAKKSDLRTSYAAYAGLPLDKWDKSAIEYSKNDSTYTRDVALAQLRRAAELEEVLGLDPLASLPLHVAADFCLGLFSERGMVIDVAKMEEIKTRIERALSERADDGEPSILETLQESGMLRPEEPPRPYANDPTRMTKGKPASKNMEAIQERIRQVWELYCEGEVPKTEPSTRFPEGQVKSDAETLAQVAAFDPALDALLERERVQKILSTEIPRMGDGSAPVRFMFNALVSSGRTSSYQDKNIEGLFSANGQNIDPRVREAYVAREGFWLCSSDYPNLEAISFASTCERLGIESEMAKIIRAGVNLHDFLGSRIVYDYVPEFRALTSPDMTGLDLLEAFVKWPLYKRWRKIAKSVVLGLPGGLSHETMAHLLRKGTMFDAEPLRVTPEEMLAFKDLAKGIFPEVPEYHNHIQNQLGDPRYSRDMTRPDKYRYSTPGGMIRSNCFFTEAANGFSMQSPSAEGAKLAIVSVTLGCYGEPDSPLWGSHPVNFLHDELILEVPIANAHEAACELARRMEDSMKSIVGDNWPLKCEPALMKAWHKDAKAVYDNNRRLTLWEPSK
jgi:hypothetical protein